MIRRRVGRALPLIVAALALHGAVAEAQRFKTERFDIGGTGGTDYLAANPETGRVYLSRGTHVLVIDGTTGAVVGDIPDTPRVHCGHSADVGDHGAVDARLRADF